MPRAPPTQVIEHRISLQDAERAAVLPILQDVGSLTGTAAGFADKANTMKQVATYGALGLTAAGLWYLPQVFARVSLLVGGLKNELGDALSDLKQPFDTAAETLDNITDTVQFATMPGQRTPENAAGLTRFSLSVLRFVGLAD